MTFEDARAELKEIAGGRYRSVEYKLTEQGDDVLEVECRCYVDPSISANAPTWRGALDMMKDKLNPQPPTPITADEAPIDESATEES